MARIGTMLPKLVVENHLMVEHSLEGRWMVAFKWFVDVTNTLMASLKKVLIVGQVVHHMHLLENALDMTIQLSLYPLG